MWWPGYTDGGGDGDMAVVDEAIRELYMPVRGEELT